MLSNVLNDINSFDLREFPEVERVFKSLSDQERVELINLLNNAQKDQMYKGLIHGWYHSEKVLVFTYLLTKQLNIGEPYRSILFDAALYHDVGRTNNDKIDFHGFAAKKKLFPEFDDSVFVRGERNFLLDGNPLYDNKYHRLLVVAIIEAHSDKEKNEKNIFDNNAWTLDLPITEDKDPVTSEFFYIYLNIVKVLKDADALDRKRFGNADFESLNPKYLRLPQSQTLVQFAEELNGLYYELFKLDYQEVSEAGIEAGDCIHSVGMDFFKINSVLQHGILSQDEMKKRMLKVPRNFSGGNFDRWISVVDVNLLRKGGTAKSEFIDRGISFICSKIKMHEPFTGEDKTEAILKGLPYSGSMHADERYVKNRIAPEHIVAIVLPKHYIHKSIRDTGNIGVKEHDTWKIRYLYNSLDIKMIRNRIKYYQNNTETADDAIQMRIIEILLQRYETILDNRDTFGKDQTTELLIAIMNEINVQIGDMIYIYYYNKIGNAELSDITVLDVVKYELSKNSSIKYTFVESDQDATFVLGANPSQLENGKTY